MSERLTNEQLRELDERLRRAVPGEAIRVSSEELNAIRRGDVMFPNLTDAAELLVLRARVAKLEAALLDCKRYAEDHDDEWVPFRVDDALSATS